MVAKHKENGDKRPTQPLQLNLLAVKRVELAEVPRMIKSGVVSALPELQDVRTIAKAVKEHGIGPYEAFDLIDFKQLKERNKEAAKLKTLAVSFVTAARRILKEFQVDKQLQLKQRQERVFLVSAESE